MFKWLKRQQGARGDVEPIEDMKEIERTIDEKFFSDLSSSILSLKGS